MAKLTKNQKIANAKVDANKQYKLYEACELVKEVSYAKFDASSIGMLYETLANAQVQIMSLLRLCDRYIEDGQKWGEVLNPNDIEDMLLQVNEVYKLLKPFEELARENGGGNVL